MIVAKAIATLKVQTGRLAEDAGEGLLAFSQWLKVRTTPADEATSAEVSRAALNQFGQLWGKWTTLLEPLRTALPDKVRAFLTDTRLTGLLVGLVVFFFVAISSGNGSSSQAKTTPPVDNRPQATRQRPARKPIEPTVTSRPYQGPPKTPTPVAPATPVPAPQKPPVPAAPVATPPVIDTPADTPSPGVSQPLPTAGGADFAEGSLAGGTNVGSAMDIVSQDKAGEATAPVVGATAAQRPGNIASTAVSRGSEPTPTIEPANKPALETNSELPSKTQPVTQQGRPAAPVAPAPKPLTPEQRRLAEVETQFKATADGYGKGLIATLEPNLRQKKVALSLSDAWFELQEADQDSLAQALYRKADSLGLGRVKICDRTGNVLVRKAVIGDGLIVLQRR